MPELVEQFEPGSSKVTEFFWWMRERHEIYLRKAAGKPKPWTDDESMRRWKFTNVFRELDTGTLALRKMESDSHCRNDPGLFLFNACWYRAFNRAEHAKYWGWQTRLEELEAYVRAAKKSGERLFTNAHFACGSLNQVMRMLRKVWRRRDKMAARMIEQRTLESAFHDLMELDRMGPFTAYEVATDLRFSVLRGAPDACSWASVGPGSRRGLRRLGLRPSVESIRWLWRLAGGDRRAMAGPEQADQAVQMQSWSGEEIGPVLLNHHPLVAARRGVEPALPLLEMREIEHSLCEFDKWVRVSSGQSRPRHKYDGGAA